MNQNITTLPGGLRVTTAPLPGRRSVSLGVWIHVGGRDEEDEISGVSHFLEHLVFKGTAKRDANQIKESVEGVGGSFNAFTSEEYTCYLAKTSSRHAEPVFDVLADMVLNASLKEEDIQKERTVVLEEIKMTQDNPGQLADENLTEMMWMGHGLGRPIAGTIESVSSLTREKIRGYRDRYYKPPLITIAASGDITQERLTQMAQERFPGGGPNVSKKEAKFSGAQADRRLRLHEKKTEQVHLCLGLHTFEKDHADQYILDILNVVLGGNMSSRLFNEVREERGLAYDISSFVRKFDETGAFVVSAGVDISKTEESLEVILKELARLLSEPVGPDELRRAKEFYLGQLDLSLENSMSQMLWIGESVVCHGRIKTPEEVASHVEKVTADDLRRVAQSIFSTRALNLSIVGPVKPERADKLKQILAFSKS